MNKISGKFITVEGIEGVGKSTCTQFIYQYLQARNIDVYLTREPGGTEIAEKIRTILLSDHEENMAQDTELLLMFASRVQHVNEIILPILNQGRFVLSDRYVDASYAYQGAGRGIDIEKIRTLENLFLANIKPDLTILLTAPIDIAMGRAKNRGKLDRFEREEKDFFERAQQMYLLRAKENPKQYRNVNAGLPLKAVKDHITTILEEFLRLVI